MARKEMPVYEIKVTLKDIVPPVWRRIVVPGNTTLLKLHDILQIVMGWQDYHLHLFTFDGENYGDPEDDEWGDLGTMPEHKYELRQLIHGVGQRFTYQYDFGDNWVHLLRVQKIGPAREGVHYPVCTDGRRASPPEDVGGVPGYANFLEAIRDPDHPEHEEYLMWIGGSFDPQQFELEAVNTQLRTMGRGRSTRRMDGWYAAEAEPDTGIDIVALGTQWVDNLPAEGRAVAQALPLRRDVVALLEYLRDHRVTGTSALGNLPLKAVTEICAQFADPPPLEERIGQHVHRVRSEHEVWPLYFRHVLASLAGLIQGEAGRRWRLTEIGGQYLDADNPAQIWFLWTTWWTQMNWAIASPYEFERGEVPQWFVWRTLGLLLELPVGEWLPFEAFADRLIESTGLKPGDEDAKGARLGLYYTFKRVVIGQLADFGVLETREDLGRESAVQYWRASSFRVTAFGRGLLEAIKPLRR